jgi:hypothetical protein
VRNKAKVGKSGVYGKRRPPPAERIHREVECAKQTQFAPAGRNLGVGSSAPNKPNLPPGGRGRPSSRPKALAMPPVTRAITRNKPNFWRAEVPIIPARCRLCKTKPICPGAQEWARAAGLGGHATNCAKRSQFGCSAGAPEAEIRETNPISEEDSGLKGQAIVRNKANLATGLGEGPQGARAAREASCTNKPNLPIGTSGRRGRAQSPVEPSRGPVAANKANSRPSGRREGSGIRPRATDAPGRGDRYNSLAVSRGCR